MKCSCEVYFSLGCPVSSRRVLAVHNFLQSFSVESNSSLPPDLSLLTIGMWLFAKVIGHSNSQTVVWSV